MRTLRTLDTLRATNALLTVVEQLDGLRGPQRGTAAVFNEERFPASGWSPRARSCEVRAVHECPTPIGAS